MDVTTPTPPPATSVKPWQSKTMWVALATSVLPTVLATAYPPGAVWVADNHQLVLAALGALFAGLRWVSHGKVSIA